MKKILSILFALLLAGLAFAAEETPPVSFFTAENMTIILGALLGVSEVLALTPLKSNSILQLVLNILRKLTGKADGV